MDKVKHALGLDKSGSGGAQGMGDNRLDGHNTYDSKAGGTGVHTAGTTGQTAGGIGSTGTAGGLGNQTTSGGYTTNPGGLGHPEGYNSNQGVGMTNAATTGSGAGYQEHHAQHQQHHGHHTGSGAVAGAVAGHHEGHTGAGALGGAAIGHEMGERGQHGHHHGQHQQGQQKEGMLHKIEAKMGMAPEQREAKKEQKEIQKEMQHGNTTGQGAGGLGQYTNSGMMNDNLTGSGVGQGGGVGTHHHGGLGGQQGNIQTVPAQNIQSQPGGFVGQADSHGNRF